MSKFKDLTGMQFGRLIAIKRDESAGRHSRWVCQCSCGKTSISHTTSLTSGRSQSCGCLNRENLTRAITKHNGRHTRLYGNWCNMKSRCDNPNHEHYVYYGGKGVRICAEWESDYGAFRNWAMENGYADGLTIDRIDVNGDYFPDNCKWSTRTEQMRNRSNTVFLEYNGVRKSLKEWCEIFNTRYKSAHARYKKGMSFKAVLNA